MAKDRQIEYLPQGWVWRSAGQDGKSARHAIRPDGSIASLREAQTLQKQERAQLGVPKAPQQRRIGKIRTQRNLGQGTNKKPDATGMFNPEIHGRIERLDFYSLQDAQNYVALNGLPSWARHGMIQIRFTERIRGGSLPGSDKIGKRNGIAALSGFSTSKTIQAEAADTTFAANSDSGNVWANAQKRVQNYDMSGNNARVYIFVQEK